MYFHRTAVKVKCYININIVECKFVHVKVNKDGDTDININIVECKF